MRVDKEGYEPFEQTLVVPSGKSSIDIQATLRKQNAAIASKTVSVTEKAERAPRPRAKAESSTSSKAGTGTLQINSRPWSQVYVDGKAMGVTPQMSLKLSAGSHKIRLHNPDFNLEKTINVSIKAGQTTKQIISLQP
ncbi:MAG: PEGA domain-containing protein [Myxococcales bacterium]|nr:MAG: PEGA domain-containing protein [Myxococcales bacterium]